MRGDASSLRLAGVSCSSAYSAISANALRGSSSLRTAGKKREREGGGGEREKLLQSCQQGWCCHRKHAVLLMQGR